MSNRLPFSEPSPSGSVRAREAKRQRDLATEISRLRPQALTRSNGEELEQAGTPVYPANFTKGLKHDDNGLLADADHYRQFVEAINSTDLTLFEKHVTTAIDVAAETGNANTPANEKLFNCTINSEKPDWRGYESPRSGHVYELQGPDAGAVGMAPAPRMRSSEFVAEIAEVYGLALLRDVPFTEIANGGDAKINGDTAEITSADFVTALGSMPFFLQDGSSRSSTPTRNTDGYNSFESNRLNARLQDQPLSTATVFRGSTEGALAGPYISQFMVAGNTSRLGGIPGGQPSFPGKSANFDAEDGFIIYGNQIIDQRSVMHLPGVDHMTEWNHWLDVQNGASLGAGNSWEDERRFITTPRDLATYVHFDALYQAYLNAALILLSLGNRAPFQKGFPEPSVSGNRTPFATFGGPHILSLVCEVATRCLKAVRRQKFNYHRRARPEATAALLSFAAGERQGSLTGTSLDELFGEQAKAIAEAEAELPDAIRDAVIEHNRKQNRAAVENLREVKCQPDGRPAAFANNADWRGSNLLLPMAFPEGSPMHPAYGAGHATVAGGCVTMLKAFFDMYTDCRGEEERVLDLDGNGSVFVPSIDGKTLTVPDANARVTIQGELDKLAANISIGRNMAGVHYYSDYYDSARMGERIAIGILMEQIPTYGEEVESTFKSFDGDLITITGTSASCPALAVCDRDGQQVSPRDWWLRHVVGEEIIEDFGG